MSDAPISAADRFQSLLAAAGQSPLSEKQTGQFLSYLSLIVRWNAKTNLTAICDEAGILSRHFLESIVAARALPEGIATLLDFGSGAGFPGIPIAICCPGTGVTLAESQGKKAAFLREAVRILEISAKVHGGRAEELRGQFDCVVLRAVDRMAEAVGTAAKLVGPGGFLGLLTTESELPALRIAAGQGFSWLDTVSMPGGAERILALGRRTHVSVD